MILIIHFPDGSILFEKFCGTFLLVFNFLPVNEIKTSHQNYDTIY